MVIAPLVSTELENLLALIAEKLQLPSSLRTKAQERYNALTDFLQRSLPAHLQIQVYPQGSYRIGTTVKPLTGEEFDLDFVIELVPVGPIDPAGLIDLVWNVLVNSDRYRGMLERRPSCIRIIYADEFHLDIVPAIPNPTMGERPF